MRLAGLVNLTDKALSPRIRDLGKITLVRDSTPTETARREPLATTWAATRLVMLRCI